MPPKVSKVIPTPKTTTLPKVSGMIPAPKTTTPPRVILHNDTVTDMLEQMKKLVDAMQANFITETEKREVKERELKLEIEYERKEREASSAQMELAVENLATNQAEVETAILIAVCIYLLFLTYSPYFSSQLPPDTDAYNKIRIWHLLNLTQAKLAHCTKIAPAGATEHKASQVWRNRVATMDPDLATRIAEATALIIMTRDAIDKPATDTFIASGALKIVVDDQKIRKLGDAAAHPGGPTSLNSKEYQDAICTAPTYPELAGEPQVEQHLHACREYVATP